MLYRKRSTAATSVAALLVAALPAIAQEVPREVPAEIPSYPENVPLSPERQGVFVEERRDTPNGGRPEINTVEEMVEIAGYTAPAAVAYAKLAAVAADGNWGPALFYHCKNPHGGTAVNAEYPVPLEVFDGVYSIGDDANNIWALTTEDGIILIDALTTEEDAYGFVVGNMMRLGLDPMEITMILVSHAHRDHTGGVAYMKELTGARIGMSQVDWELALASDEMPPKSEEDFYITDGMQITLGERTLTALVTPGHTPGTVSLMIPVTWNGEEHMASYAGGQGTPRSIPEIVQWRTSMDHIQTYNNLLGADVIMSNHTIGDDGLTKIADMAANPGTNPYIVGREAVIGYYESWRNCLSADIEQMIADGQQIDPVTMMPAP